MQYRVSTFKRVCLAKNVRVKSIKSGRTRLLASAQKDVNSKLLLVFFFLAAELEVASLMALRRVVLE